MVQSLEDHLGGEGAFVNLTVEAILTSAIKHSGVEILDHLTKNIPVPPSQKKTIPRKFASDDGRAFLEHTINVTNYVVDNGLNGLSQAGRHQVYTNLREIYGDHSPVILHNAVSLMPENPLIQFLLASYRLRKGNKKIIPGEAFEQTVERAANKLNKLMHTTPDGYTDTSLRFSTRYHDPNDAIADGSIITLAIAMNTVKNIEPRAKKFEVTCYKSPFTKDEELAKQRFYDSIGITYDISHRIESSDGSESYGVEWDLSETKQKSESVIRRGAEFIPNFLSVGYQLLRAKRLKAGKPPFPWERASNFLSNCIGQSLYKIGQTAEFFLGHDPAALAADKRAGKVWDAAKTSKEEALEGRLEAADARTAEAKAETRAVRAEAEVGKLKQEAEDGEKRARLITSVREIQQRHARHGINNVIGSIGTNAREDALLVACTSLFAGTNSKNELDSAYANAMCDYLGIRPIHRRDPKRILRGVTRFTRGGSFEDQLTKILSEHSRLVANINLGDNPLTKTWDSIQRYENGTAPAITTIGEEIRRIGVDVEELTKRGANDIRALVTNAMTLTNTKAVSEGRDELKSEFSALSTPEDWMLECLADTLLGSIRDLGYNMIAAGGSEALIQFGSFSDLDANVYSGRLAALQQYNGHSPSKILLLTDNADGLPKKLVELKKMGVYIDGLPEELQMRDYFNLILSDSRLIEPEKTKAEGKGTGIWTLRNVAGANNGLAQYLGKDLFGYSGETVGLFFWDN